MTVKKIPRENQKILKPQNNGHIGAILVIGTMAEAGDVVKLANEAVNKIHSMFGGKLISSKYVSPEESNDKKTAMYIVVAEFETETVRDVWESSL